MKMLLCYTLALSATACLGQSPAPTPASAPSSTPAGRITPGAKVFLEPMAGFETYLSAAILKKKVPLMVVDSKDSADYVLTGNSQIEKAGWAKTIFISPLPHADASVSMKDAHSGVLVFAYAVDKANSRHGEQSTAEAVAKHLKDAIEKK